MAPVIITLRMDAAKEIPVLSARNG